MTVAELIEQLKTKPQEAVVQFSYRVAGSFSDDSDTYYVTVREVTGPWKNYRSEDGKPERIVLE